MQGQGTRDGRALAEAFDLRALDDAFFENPYPVYHALREHAPVLRLPDGGYFLTRYADVAAVYRSRDVSSDKRVMFRPTLGDGPIYEHHTTSLVFNDPPYHTRVRQAIQGVLTHRMLRATEPALVRLVDGLLDRIEEMGSFDLIEDFAAAIPVEVIGNLLRVPRADRGPLRGWSLAILGALEPRLTDEARERANAAVEEFSAYLRELIAERRRRLVLDGTDALSELIAVGREGGEPLTEHELVHNAIFLLNAGHETTTNLIGNGIATLIEHGAWERLRRAPELLPSAVEEFLRFESSNQLGNRTVVRPIEIGGELLEAGAPITMCIGAANRDPAQFPEPDRLDLARSPNRHLAFGLGIHACAGMHLARLEGRVAIGRMVARFPGLERAGEPVRARRARFRGYLSCPVALARP